MSEIRIFRQSSAFKDSPGSLFCSVTPSICQNPAASLGYSFPLSGNFQTAYLALQLLLLDGVPVERDRPRGRAGPALHGTIQAQRVVRELPRALLKED
jgi:hypothetical protein